MAAEPMDSKTLKPVLLLRIVHVDSITVSDDLLETPSRRSVSDADGAIKLNSRGR
jgi:hypothetical protein